MDKTVELLCAYNEVKEAIADPRTYWIVLSGSRSIGAVDDSSDYDIIVYGEYEHEAMFTTIVTDDANEVQLIHHDVSYLSETNPAAWPTGTKTGCCGFYLSAEIQTLYIAEGKEEDFKIFFAQFKEKAAKAAKIILYKNLNTIRYCTRDVGVLDNGHRIKHYYYILLAYYVLSGKTIDLDLLTAIKHMSRYNKPEISSEYYDQLREICSELLTSYNIDSDPIEENELIYVSNYNTTGFTSITQNTEN